MKDFDTFKVIEAEDIETAIDHIAQVGRIVAAQMEAKNYEGQGQQDAEEFAMEFGIVMYAAAVGAAVARDQGGIVAMPETMTQQEIQAAQEKFKDFLKGEVKKARVRAVWKGGRIKQ